MTEGVRGEGGILKNSEGRRFIYDDIPDNYKDQTAGSPEGGWRYTQGDKNARRLPELLRATMTDVSWNYAVKKRIEEFKLRPADAPDGTRRMRQEDIDRVQDAAESICVDILQIEPQNQEALVTLVLATSDRFAKGYISAIR